MYIFFFNLWNLGGAAYSQVCSIVQNWFLPSVFFSLALLFSPFSSAPSRCDMTCFCRVLGMLNLCPHSLHIYGFSPVCVRRWYLSKVMVLHSLPQSVQAYPSEPKWFFLWHVSSDDFLKACPQMGHLKGFFSTWAFWWAMSSVELVKWRSQT